MDEQKHGIGICSVVFTATASHGVRSPLAHRLPRRHLDAPLPNYQEPQSMEEKGKGRRSEEQAREGFSREEEEKGLIMRKKGNVAGREEEEKEGGARE